MPYTPPNKLLIKSNDNILELIKTIPKDEKRKVDSFVYRFSKSIENENTEIEMTEVQLKMNLRHFFREIK